MINFYAMAGGALLFAGLSIGLYNSVRANGELRAEVSRITSERDHAKDEAETLAAASRRHARQLAQSGQQARRESATVARSGDDGCLDRRIAPDVLGTLRMLTPSTDRKTSTAPAG